MKSSIAKKKIWQLSFNIWWFRHNWVHWFQSTEWDGGTKICAFFPISHLPTFPQKPSKVGLVNSSDILGARGLMPYSGTKRYTSELGGSVWPPTSHKEQSMEVEKCPDTVRITWKQLCVNCITQVTVLLVLLQCQVVKLSRRHWLHHSQISRLSVPHISV